jgi:hypothetical protein
LLARTSLSFLATRLKLDLISEAPSTSTNSDQTLCSLQLCWFDLVPASSTGESPAQEPFSVSVQSSGPGAGFPVWCSESCGVERVEAEAIYDAGRGVCVQFILDLAGRVEQLEERLNRLEARARQDSRTSSLPPSSDLPKSRAQRRAEVRARAKELMRWEGERRQAGGQPGHRGAGRELRPEDQIDEIVDHYPPACGGCGRRFGEQERRPRRRFGRHQVCELPPISV